MTKTPKRLVEDEGASSRLARDVLAGDTGMRMPPGEKQRLWAVLEARLPLEEPAEGHREAPLSPTHPPHETRALGENVARLAGVPAIKAGVVVLMLGVSAAASYEIWGPSRTEGSPAVFPSGRVAPVMTTEPTNSGARRPAVDTGLPVPPVGVVSSGESARFPEPRKREVAEITTGEQISPAAVPDASGPIAAPSSFVATTPGEPTSPSASHVEAGYGPAAPLASSDSRRSQLDAETRALREARGALRRGDARAALSVIDASNRAFAGGALGEEREALAVEATASAGAREEAVRRARAFLAAHPGSVHAADMRALADGAPSSAR